MASVRGARLRKPLDLGGQDASPGRQEPFLRREHDATAVDRAEVQTETIKLRSCVEMLAEAMRFEGIDAHTPLGVWCQALQATMLSLGRLVDMQTARIEERAEAMAKPWQAQTEVHSQAIEELRAATQACRAETTRSEEKRKADGQLLAGEVATDIKQAITATMVVREVQWNRRQNWTAAAITAAILVGFFVSGSVWSRYQNDRGIAERCLKKQVLDNAGHQYCPMKVVQGEV